jgi:hypothetical protein
MGTGAKPYLGTRADCQGVLELDSAGHHDCSGRTLMAVQQQPCVCLASSALVADWITPHVANAAPAIACMERASCDMIGATSVWSSDLVPYRPVLLSAT